MRGNRMEIHAEARRILALAWPIMLTGLNWTLMHLIDVAIVGHAGTEELGALAASRAVSFIVIVIGLAGLTGVLVFVARADGGGRLAESGDVLKGGLLLGLVLGVVALVGLLARAEALLHLLGVAESLVPHAARVLRAIALAYPFQFTMAAASYFLEGISRPRRVMIVNLGMLPLNAVLAVLLVFGWAGLPALGAVGAMLATALASVAGAAAMLALAWTAPAAAARGVRDWSLPSLRRAAPWAARLAWFGCVPALAAALEMAGFSYLIVLSTHLGLATAAAFQAVFSLHNLTFAMAMGFGSAAGVRVGNAVGAGVRAEAWPRALIAGGATVAVIGALALVLFVAARPVTVAFSEDPAVRELAAAMLMLMAPFMIFDGVQYVFASALRSLGEQVWAGINGIIGFFLITGGLGWLAVQAGWGATGLVLAGGIGMVSAAALQFARFAWVLRRSDRTAGSGADPLEAR